MLGEDDVGVDDSRPSHTVNDLIYVRQSCT